MKTRLVADFVIEDGPIDEDGEYQPDLAKYKQVIVSSIEEGIKIINRDSLFGDGRIYTEVQEKDSWDGGLYWTSDGSEPIPVAEGMVY